MSRFIPHVNCPGDSMNQPTIPEMMTKIRELERDLYKCRTEEARRTTQWCLNLAVNTLIKLYYREIPEPTTKD